MTLPRFLAIAVVAIPLSVAGCQTTGGKSGSPTYTVFFDQGDHLEQLLAEQNHAAAVRLHNEHQDYFVERRETYQAELQLLADHIEKTFEVRLARAEEGLGSVGWPSPTADWPRIRMALDEVGTTVADYDRRHLAGGAFRSERFHRIGARRAALHEEIEVAAADEFARFDHFAGQSFFTRYPIDLDGPAFMSEHFERIADTVWASPADALVRFLKTYQEGDVLAADLRAKIGAKYVALTLEAEMAGAGGGLAALMRTVAKAAAADIEISSLPDARFGLVEATSRTLLEQGQIQFPVAIEADLPFDVATADLDDALSTAVGEAADYLIVFDVALAKAERRIRARKGHSSKFLAGTREVPNPSYATKQFELVAAQQELQGVRLRNALNNSSNTADATIFGAMIEAIVEGIVERKADEAVEEALAALQSTPRTVSEPIFEPYAYSSAEVEARRLLTVNYYVIDRARGTYFKSSFDASEEREFALVFAVHTDDPDKERHFDDAHSEQEIDEWERSPLTVTLSSLVEHYLERADAARPLPGHEAIRAEMLADKNLALAAYRENTFDARPLNDPRFDSVVVVYTPEGSLGSGFFIRPDVVLTNYHVVEGAKFVEMKLYDGQETFGKVIDSDIRLDLALVKVQARGRPVAFYRERTLPLGAEVEVIGHPEGFEFSITRGIVSALRRVANIRGVGGDDVLFVQTDAPVNHGNSGGPLFLDDRVIGVNTWGASKQISEGLNFSVHYSEVLAFINREAAIN